MHLNVSEKAARLGLLLERGFSEAAGRELRETLADVRQSPLERASAAWVLSRHAYIARAIQEALNLLKICDEFTAGGPTFAGQEEAHIICLENLGQYTEARARLEPLMINLATDGPSAHLYFLYATVLRGQMLGEDVPLDEIEAMQLGHINRVLTACGLAPLAKRNEDEPLSIDNICAPFAAPSDVSAAPLVSVIVPAYNAAETIAAGLAGLVAQTWQNLEIIVVDDASRDNTAEIVSQMARKDARIRLMQQPFNQGAYRARNAGAEASAGELITVCDSDDWPHPQRTETLVRHLVNNPKRVTVHGQMVKVDPHLETGRDWLPSAAFVDDPSSHIFTREMFFDIGPWDGDVRTGADSELIDRVFRQYGSEANECVTSPSPLLFGLNRERGGAMTRTGPTHLKSMAHASGARFHHFKAYRHWHLAALAAGKTVHIAEKAFSAPPAMRPERKEGNYDLTLIANFSHAGTALEILQKAVLRGQSLAIVNWPEYADIHSSVISPDIYDICFSSGIDILCSADRAKTKHLLFVPPLDFENFLDALPQLTAEHAELPEKGRQTLTFHNLELADLRQKLKGAGL